MDFPYILGLPIVYFKGSQVEFLYYDVVLSLEIIIYTKHTPIWPIGTEI